MVLSCSLRDFLSPLGMEIRLGLCKRIFYFFFFPLPPLFSMFVVQIDLFGNLIWIFFLLHDQGIFFFTTRCITEHRRLSHGFLAVENSGKALFSNWQKRKIVVYGYFWSLALVSRNSALKMKTYPWTLAAFNDIMDNYQLEDWWIWWKSSCDLSSVCWLDCCMNLFFSLRKFSHDSRVNYCLPLLALCDWYARLTWLLIKVAGKTITTFDILGMLSLLFGIS